MVSAEKWTELWERQQTEAACKFVEEFRVRHGLDEFSYYGRQVHEFEPGKCEIVEVFSLVTNGKRFTRRISDYEQRWMISLKWTLDKWARTCKAEAA